jgi:hypothetical protein
MVRFSTSPPTQIGILDADHNLQSVALSIMMGGVLIVLLALKKRN